MYQPSINAIKDLFFVVLRVNATHDNGDRSLLLSVSEDASDLQAGKQGGALVSHSVSEAVFKQGFCPGATGLLVGGFVAESKDLRNDGTHWLRLRKPAGARFVQVKKGNQTTSTEDVEFED
jgi:hypothetical protein